MMDRTAFPDHRTLPNVAVRRAGHEDFPSVVRLYEEWGYGGTYTPSDMIWLAEAGAGPVGVVRLVHEEGTVVLRGMFVTAAWRNNGIAGRLLEAATRELDEPCWCIPFAYLEPFYARFGFVAATETEAPSFLVERLGRYRWTGRDYRIMRRSGS
ncbi:GNAT family N-acetyltransferase [Paludibacterium paludis]|uniref:N-acetyltransferase domain-containing protein n=1 Tax=Paludibacterium paludis TaxID=1225769 RepID=A0A918P5A7_9NEIS|nr:GNAT family N-acetyltransferase [Paludibacterium paludis]GGY21469.1 hypothetical protein GCM10011289_26310 [Paludibacterium paludis]